MVVLPDLSADELPAALVAEIQRVLYPWYDVAVLGDASGKLNMSRLTGWAEKIAADVSRLSGGGNVVTVKTGPLEGDQQ
jgi:hypothetical protein